jgi:hypothetical protein
MCHHADTSRAQTGQRNKHRARGGCPARCRTPEPGMTVRVNWRHPTVLLSARLLTIKIGESDKPGPPV